MTAITARDPNRSAGEEGERVTRRGPVAWLTHPPHGTARIGVDAAAFRGAAVDAQRRYLQSSGGSTDLPSELSAVLANRTTGDR